jgi:hypothetical protein
MTTGSLRASAISERLLERQHLRPAVAAPADGSWLGAS